MKIVHVEDYFDPTAGYQINELLNVSRNFDDEVFLITSNSMKPFHKEVDFNKDREFESRTGVKIIRLEAKLIIATRVLLKNLYNTIDEINPDVVFFHGIGDFKDLLLWKKKRKYKIIRDCHMSWVASKNKFRKVYYKIFKLLFSRIINNTNKYDKIYALGDEEYEYLRVLGISDKKIDYLYHGYNSEIMYYDIYGKEEIRNKYDIESDDIVISYIGKFDEHKRPDLIFDIIAGLPTEYIKNNKIKLLFIGSKNNDYMNKFNEKLSKISKNTNVIIDDSKPFVELKKYFSASDICIFPKECTLSSIHAQVCGCIVIMENHKSNIERVINSNHLYDIDNISEATKILKDIIDNEEYKKRAHINDEKIESREYKKQIQYFKNSLNI